MTGRHPCEPGCNCGRHNSENHYRWSDDNASYRAKHKRAIKIRGGATNYDCIDCGKQARDWSLKHGLSGLDAYDFDPRCRPCHVKYDVKFHPKEKGRFVEAKL